MAEMHLQCGDQVYIRRVDKIFEADDPDLMRLILRGPCDKCDIGGEGFTTYWDDGNDDVFMTVTEDPRELQALARAVEASDPRSPRFNPDLVMTLPETNRFRQRALKALRRRSRGAEDR